MARVLSLKQLQDKKYKFLENLPERILESFGQLTDAFVMIVWGMSGNGKSNFLMQFLKALMPYGKVLYVGLEEGFEATMQNLATRHFEQEVHSGKIQFANHEMTFEELWNRLCKKKQAKFIVIDSIQYWNIDYEMYKRLKERFPNKTFIIISHAKGKQPDGKTADKIRYDAGIKVYVEGFVAFIKSRYMMSGVTKPFVIYEDGARKHWGKDYDSIIKHGIEYTKRNKRKPTKRATTKKKEHE